MNLNMLIQKTRADFGDAPRKFSFFKRGYNKVKPPSWMDIQADGLAKIYQDYLILLEKGQVVWGQIVQANGALFQIGSQDAPAALVFSMDKQFDKNLEDLHKMSTYLFSFKNQDTTGMSEELKHFIDIITDELERVFNEPLPADLTEGREVYFTTFMVHRKHMPGGRIVQGFFPILAAPELTDQIMPLPEKYWPRELFRFWMDV